MVKRHFRKITPGVPAATRFRGFQMPKPELGLVELERAGEPGREYPGPCKRTGRLHLKIWRVDWKTTDIYKGVLGAHFQVQC